jgi:hypothetical protein
VGNDLYRVVVELFDALPSSGRSGRFRIRLLGVAGSGLRPSGADQLALVRAGRWEDAERALDRIERRFGEGAAFPASLLDRGSTPG